MDLQKYITKNKKENKSMFLFSSETAKMETYFSGGGVCTTQNFLS